MRYRCCFTFRRLLVQRSIVYHIWEANRVWGSCLLTVLDGFIHWLVVCSLIRLRLGILLDIIVSIIRVIAEIECVTIPCLCGIHLLLLLWSMLLSLCILFLSAKTRFTHILLVLNQFVLVASDKIIEILLSKRVVSWTTCSIVKVALLLQAKDTVLDYVSVSTFLL